MTLRVLLCSLGLAVFAVLALAITPPRAASAQEGKAPVIIVIDTQRILRDSKAVQSIQKQVGKKRDAYQEEIKAKEKTLFEKEQELRRQSTILSTEVYAQKKRELEEQVGGLQREIQEKRKALNKVLQQGMREVEKALVQITREIAKGRKADLVLQRTTIVYVRPEMEITAEALEKLNASLPSVELPVATQ